MIINSKKKKHYFNILKKNSLKHNLSVLIIYFSNITGGPSKSLASPWKSLPDTCRSGHIGYGVH